MLKTDAPVTVTLAGSGFVSGAVVTSSDSSVASAGAATVAGDGLSLSFSVTPGNAGTPAFTVTNPDGGHVTSGRFFVAATGDVAVGVGSTNVVAGRTISLVLSSVSPLDRALGGWTIGIGYDAGAIIITGCTTFNLGPSSDFSSPGTLQVQGSSTGGVPILDPGVSLARISFTVAGAAGAQLTLTTSVGNFVDVSQVAIPTVAANGTVKVVAPCDVDGDGHLSPGDALKTLRMYAGLEAAYPGVADVDQDGRLAPGDALIVLRSYAGLQSCPS